MTPEQAMLYDKKWLLFASRARLFRHIPFIDFVFGGGSLAMGNVDNESDFDVLVGVRPGRIFTVRFIAAALFALRGWRRSKAHGGADAANKICLNHFVTPSSYRLKLPVNTYWRLLYERLIPLYGSPEAMRAFFDANESWLGRRDVDMSDLRYQGNGHSLMRRITEKLLSGRLGEWCEAALRRYQVARIEKGMMRSQTKATVHRMRVTGAPMTEMVHLPPLVVYGDEELEFHPDPANIEITEELR